MRAIGILPAVGSGLSTMAKAGQLGRLAAYMEAWREAFPSLRYFSYLPFASEVNAIRALPSLLFYECAPTLRSALTWPLREASYWKVLHVARCMNLLAAVPAITARIVHGIPFAVSYGADYETIASIHGDHGQRWKWRWLRAVVFRTASVVMVPNKQMSLQLKARYPRAPIVHHPNWVDLERFRPLPLPDPDGARRVYYWGRLVAEKNLPMAARACRKAGATLCCIGEGPEAPAIYAAGGVILCPVPYEDLPSLLGMADAFILPSLSEGHPKALLEALALGLPCLVSDRVAWGIPCIRFDPTNEASIVQAIRTAFGATSYAYELRRAGPNVASVFGKPARLAAEVSYLEAIAR